MKLLCYTDNHFSEKSSIITKYGVKYTVRLENQIKSLDWLETLALSKDCDFIVCLGDFFDHAHLTDQELTALKDIQWSNIPHFFLVGNHESEENDLQYSSTMALLGPNREVIASPCLLTQGEVELAFLPYIVESNRKPILEYFTPCSDKLRILFTHNDILGLQLGPVVSRSGFSIEELESVSHLCLNGHLHNGQAISPQVINLGNLTGKDFSEDALKYTHKAILIDTDTMQVDFFENPHAFNFYKLEFTTEDELASLASLKSNAVVSVKCKDSLVKPVREALSAAPNIIESRVIVVKDALDNFTEKFDANTLYIDQCAKFAECCRARLDNNDILELELAEILK
jgi:DNA repair exonuclease SbcCD nuclease subunit